MKAIKILLILFFAVGFSSTGFAQCSQSISINSISAECNGDGTSTVTINVTVIFGNGNNSAVISYNIGAGEVNAVVLEDDNGDIINQTYMFNVPSCDDYTVTLTAWTNPSGGGTSCTDPPPVTAPVVLPVKFGEFELYRRNSDVIVEWTTLSETNNEKFVIEKAGPSFDFSAIGTTQGSINSVNEKRYSFIDNNASNGINYYRIRQIDLDGAFSFSDIRSISIKNSVELLVYPNPASEMITISTENAGVYRIVNSNNNLIKVFQAVGSNYDLDLYELEPGIYYVVRVDKKGFSSFIKL